MESPVTDERDPASIPLPRSPEEPTILPSPAQAQTPAHSSPSVSRASSVSVPAVKSPEVSPRTLVRPRLPGRGQTITSLRAQREEDAWEAQETIEGRGGPDPFLDGTTITVNEPVGSLSISPSNRDIALASRKGLFILDLANLNVAPRFVPQGGTWQIADCQWSPHPFTSNLILSTSSQKLLVWDLLSTSPSTSLHRSINAHARAITDINWHARNPNLMATTGMDGGVRGWDLRVGDDRPVMRVCAWNGAGTQCKWNRQHDHLLATAHGGEVFVWDNRKGSLPVTIIKAHDAKIYGIDWDRISRHELVTCSLDKTVKFWSIAEMSPAARPSPSNLVDFFPTLPAPDTPTSTIHTSYPVWRARNLPFGRGCMSLPQRGDNALEMWQTTQGDGPVERFQGHSDVVKEFVWRTRGGQDPAYEDRDFQLITWAKDRTVRIWPMEPEILEKVGYKRGVPIEVLVSRRHAMDISYTRPELLPEEVLCPTSANSLGFPSNTTNPATAGRAPYVSVPTTGALQIIASARAHPSTRPIVPGTEHLGGKAPPAVISNAPSGIARQGKALHAAKTVPARKAAMTRGGAGQKSKAGGQISQVDWLTKVVKVPRENHDSHDISSAEASHLTSRVGSVSVSKSRRESDSRPSSRSRDRRTMLSSSVDGGGDDKFISLKDEIVLVLQTFPKPKINFELVDIAHRKITMTLNGPWAEGDRLAFTRIHVVFPPAYPYSSAPEDFPSFELEKNHSVPPTTRQRIVQTLKAIRAHNRQCVLAWCSFLLGYNERLGRTMFDDDNDSESDKEDEPVSLPMLARTCGASFGPNGELVCFFQKQVSVPRQRGSVSRSPSLGSKVTHFSSQQVHSPTLIKAMSALSRMNGPHQKRRKHGDLAMAVAQGLANRPFRRTPLSRTTFAIDPAANLKASSVVSVRDFSHLGGVPHRGLAEVYETTGLPDIVCARNMKLALAAGKLDHAQAWSMLASVLSNVPPVNDEVRARHPNLPRGEQPAFSTANDAWDRKIARKKVIVDKMVSELAIAGDIQLLALIACVMSQYIVIPSTASSAKHVVIQSPERDYFALPRRTSSNAAYTATSNTLVPNTPRQQSPTSQSPIGFPGLSGYSGYSFSSSKNSGWSQILNSSGISLRSNTFNAASAGMASFRERMPSDASVLKTPTLSTSFEENSSASHSIPVPAGSKAHPHPPPSPRPKEARSGSMRERSNSPRPRLGYTPGKSAGSTDPGSARSGRVAFGGSQSPMRKAVAGRAGGYAPPPMSRKAGNGKKWSVGVDVGPEENHSATMSVLDPSLLWQYESYRRVYADFLLRWEIYGKRAALLQYSLYGEMKSKPHIGLELSHVCPHCNGRVLTASASACPGCERPRAPPRCAVCRLPVRGLATACLLCTHVSHARCLAEHFGPDETTACPSGCGCACLTEAGISGTFESLPLATSGDFDVADWHGERVQEDSPAPTPQAPIPTPPIPTPALGLTTNRAAAGGLLAKARLRGLTGDALLHW